MRFMYPGVVAMTVVMTSLFSGLSVVWDREFGFLKELLVAPLSRSGIVLGKAAGASLVALAQTAVRLLPARAFGITPGPLTLAMLLVAVAELSLAVAGLGILVASRMRSQQSFQVVMQLLLFPLLFLSGAFFPVNNLPAWLGFVVRCNPVTYGIDAIRQLLLGAAVAASDGGRVALAGVTSFGRVLHVPEELGLVALLGLLFMAAAAASFGRQE